MEKQTVIAVNPKLLIAMGLALGLVVGFFAGFFLANYWNMQALRLAQPANPSAVQLPEGHPQVGSQQDPQAAMEMVRKRIEELKQAADSDAKNTAARIELGNMYFDVGKYEQAIEWYAQALAVDPSNNNVRTDMATALHYTGQHDRALAELEKVLKSDPYHPQALINLGIVRKQGKNDARGALEAWERFITTNPNFPHVAEVKKWVEELKKDSR